MTQDKIAKQLVENLFNASISKRINIIDVGSKENVIRMTSAHYLNLHLGKAIGIGDGDMSDTEIRNGCKKYMGLSADECHKVTSGYFCTLPSDQAPEIYILNKLQSSDEFIRDIDDSPEFENFIKNELDILEDHHSLFYKIAHYLSKNEDGIMRDILHHISKNYKDDFQNIIDLVNQKLNIT